MLLAAWLRVFSHAITLIFLVYLLACCCAPNGNIIQLDVSSQIKEKVKGDQMSQSLDRISVLLRSDKMF